MPRSMRAPTRGPSGEEVMNVTCPSCATIYRVDPDKVPERGVRARCRVCAAVFAVDRSGHEVPDGTPAGVGAGPAPAQVATPFDSWKDPLSTQYEAPARPEPAPVPSGLSAPPPAPPAREEAAAPVVPAPPREEPPRAPLPPAAPSSRPGALIGMPPVVPPGAGRGSGGTTPAAPSRPAGRRVNPFMTQDPDQKARRLARALISDLVVYYPERREEGLRNDNLKSLFDEEIRKSWEEYTDQVGEEMAEGTSHFTDALNEILAGGRQVF